MVLARFALANAKVIGFAVAVLAVLGVRASVVTPQSIFPTMSFSRIDVVADAGELPPDQVEVAVVRPLEQALQNLPSVEKVQSTASQGSGELVVSFSSNTDPRIDLEEVDQAIAQARGGIPDASNVVAVIVNPNSEPVLSYALTSQHLSLAVLRQIAENDIRPKLYGIPGLGRLSISGGPATEYHVDLDAAALGVYGIGPGDVEKALTDANAVRAVGVTDRWYQRYALVVDSSLHDRASLERVLVPVKNGGAVPLSTLGTVRLGVSPVTAELSIDGRAHAVMLNAYGLPGADTVRMASLVRERIAGLSHHLPADIGIRNFWDQTTLVVESQRSLRDAILLGALLAVVVIYAFLRSLRLTLVAAAVIPIAMAIAVFALELAGQSLNLMSVGGLAVAVGLIIDDAIVVIENISRNLSAAPGTSLRDTIARAMAQISGPMAASTAATVVVFLPLSLLSGVTGYFFRALAFTLAASLVVSLGLALLVAPTIAALLLGRQHEEERPLRWFDALLDRYDALLRWTLVNRAFVFAGSAASLVITALILLRLPSDFLPKMDEGQFEIAYTMPTGTSLSASDAAATAMERIVRADPAVAAVGRLTGLDSNGFSPTQANQGLLRVRLLPEGKRDGYDAVAERLRERLSGAVPASLFDFHQILEDLINGLSGVRAPIEVAIRGSDQQQLIALAQRTQNAISRVHGVVDASSGVVYDAPSVRVSPDGVRLAALGLTTSDVGDAVASLLQGSVVTDVAATRSVVPVRVIVGRGATDAGDLQQQSLLAKGNTTAVGDVADLHVVRLSSERQTENGQPLVRVTANIEGAALSDVTSRLGAVLARIPLPPGYAFEVGGRAQTQAQSFAEFAAAIGIAIALVFAVMLATFRSFRLPLVVITTIPLALIGVALGLLVTGTPFNVSSFMGLLLLVGLVVKNGILLIDVANRRRAAGDSVVDALAAAGRARSRPIVMTTLAAIGGLLPLAFGLGQGSEMERPLAIAVIGGLSTATAFTLVVIPVLYAAFAGREAHAA